MTRRQMWAVVFLLATLLSTRATGAQTVTAEPLTCWWRTSVPAIRVGETFSVILTCAVLQTDTVSIVVDESKLEPSVVQFEPFEVLSGSHGADLHTDRRRFFQYEYWMRLIAENEFGKDVPLPETTLSYRVQSRVGGNAAIQGRDQSYVLPQHAIRVLSLVPAGATDIRDSSAETFADIDQRGFRASLFLVIGGVLFSLAGLLALLALVRLIMRYRRPATGAERLASDGAVLRAVHRELERVRREREAGGWTSDLAARGLSAVRVTAAYAMGRQAAQSHVTRRQSDGSAAPETNGDGTVIVTTGWRKTKTVAISASTTARWIAHEIARGSAGASRSTMLSSLQDALTDLTEARYGSNGTFDDAALDQAVAAGATAARRLGYEQSWLMQRFRRRRPAPQVDIRAWSR